MKLPPDSLSSLQGKSLLPDPSRPSVAESGANIGQTFERMLMEVNRQHQEAEQKQVELLTASEKDIHGTVIAMEKAEISLRLLLQVRNKAAAHEALIGRHMENMRGMRKEQDAVLEIGYCHLY